MGNFKTEKIATNQPVYALGLPTLGINQTKPNQHKLDEKTI